MAFRPAAAAAPAAPAASSAAAAAACAAAHRGVGVADDETAAHQALDVVDAGPVDERSAVCVHQHAHRFGLDDDVVVTRRLFHPEHVLQAASGARHHHDPEHVAGLILLGKHLFQLAGCQVGHLDQRGIGGQMFTSQGTCPKGPIGSLAARGTRLDGSTGAFAWSTRRAWIEPAGPSLLTGR